MLTTLEVGRLARELDGTRVLTVYLDGRAVDPAERLVWRRALGNAMKPLEEAFGTDPAFTAAAAALERYFAPVRGALGAPGWVAFVTAEGVRHTAPLPGEVPTMARWEAGPVLGPYFAAITEARPALVLVADRRRTTMWRWNGETLTPGPVLHAPELPQIPDKMRNAPGAAGQVRGMVGSEALEVAVAHAFEQMARAVVTALAEAPDDAVLVLGGIPDAALALQRALPQGLERRSVIEAIDVHATPAIVAEVARRAAAKAHANEVLGLEQSLFEEALGRGRAAVGREEVLRALREQSVRALFVTPSVAIEALPADEAAVHAALAQGAEVVVTPDHGDRIDLSTDGLAALLRFAPMAGTPPA